VNLPHACPSRRDLCSIANYNASNICVEKEFNAPDVPPGGTSEALHITTLLHIYKGKMRTAADVPPGGTSAALHIILPQISM